MNSFLPDFGFPLLTKDLIEQAQRRRTYVLRTVIALFIYIIVISGIVSEVIAARSNGPFATLGIGKKVLESLFLAATFGIYFVLPAMTCGAVAGERERNTWNLLRVTHLGDTGILLEKYLGRVVAAASFLILSIPVMTVAYPLGGVTPARIIDAFWCLFLCVLLVAAVGLCCSAWCRTIVGALLSTYFLLVAQFLIPLFSLMILYPGLGSYDESLLHKLIVACFPRTREEAYLPWILFMSLDRVPPTVPRLPLLSHYSLPTLFQIGFFLFLARLGIARPIETGGRSFWKSLFIKLDGWFQRINQNRFTRGREFQIHRSTLPVDHPIAWRESSRVLFKHPVYRIRLLVGLLALVTAFMPIIADEGTDFALTMVNALLFLLGCIVLSITAAGLFSRERNCQTLDVLLATPVSHEELLRDKLAGVRYWHVALIVLSLLILFVRAYLSGFYFWQIGPSILMSSHHAPLQFFSDLVTLLYLPRLIIWVSVAIGLRFQSHMSGVLCSLAFLGAWAALGIFIANLGATGSDFDFFIALFGAALSPFYTSSLCFVWESYYLRNGWPLILVVLNAIFYWILTSRLKDRCRRHLDQSLNRLESSSPRNRSKIDDLSLVEKCSAPREVSV